MTDDLPDLPDTREKVRFHQIKSNYFRVIHADGIWASMSPRHYVHLTFFNEREPIPREVVHELIDGRKLGAEIKEERVKRKDWVREMEVEVVMSYDRALELNAWLGKYLERVRPK